MLWKDKEIFISFPNSPKSLFERVFIQTDKFSGSLRYTFDQKEADSGKCRNVFRNLDSIEILDDVKDEGQSIANLVDEK